MKNALISLGCLLALLLLASSFSRAEDVSVCYLKDHDSALNNKTVSVTATIINYLEGDSSTKFGLSDGGCTFGPEGVETAGKLGLRDGTRVHVTGVMVCEEDPYGAGFSACAIERAQVAAVH